MALKTLLLLSLTFPLLSLSSTRNAQTAALDGTCRVTATGGLGLDVRGTAWAGLRQYTYRGVPDTRGYARDGQPTTMLTIRLIAPGSQWHTLFVTVTNHNSRTVMDKLYHWTPIDYRGGEGLRDENVECRLELTDGPEYWDLDYGEISFEYYGGNRVRGTFNFEVLHMFYRRAEPDASKRCRLSGSFDTAYEL